MCFEIRCAIFHNRICCNIRKDEHNIICLQFVCQLEMSLFAEKQYYAVCTHVYKKLIFSSKCNKRGSLAVVRLYCRNTKCDKIEHVHIVHVGIIHGCTLIKYLCGIAGTCSLLLYISYIDAAASNEKNVMIVFLTKCVIIPYSFASVSDYNLQ